MTGLVVQCQGPCQNERFSAELNSDGWCKICVIVEKATPFFLEYKRLWRRRAAYLARGISTASCDKQIYRQVQRITRECHNGLPVNGAIKLVNEILERARAEATGHSRILTVDQGTAHRG